MKNVVANTFLTVLFTLMATGIFSQAFATNNHDKMTICHGTGSQSNPYVRIVVSKNSHNGHFNTNSTPRAGHENDILLEGEKDCPNGTQNPSCSETSAHENLTGSVDLQGNGTVTNHSTGCSYKVGLASYQMFDTNIDNQTLFDSETKTIGAGQTLNLHVDLPTCAYQIDLFKGDVIQSFSNGVRYGSRLIDGKQVVNPPSLCLTTTPTPTPAAHTQPALTTASTPQSPGGPAGSVLAATTLPATGADLQLNVFAQIGFLAFGIALRRFGR